MADETGISWTDATFNPWLGCAKVSPACARCYAETFSENRMGIHVWGADAERRVTADATWRKPLRWAKIARDGFLPGGRENKDGHRPRVFCASMADVFEERLDLEPYRERLFELIADTPELDWLILTKRPDFAKTYLVTGRQATPTEVDEGFELGWVPPLYYDGMASARRVLGPVPLPNVWLGVSIENSRFTWRADVLREIPAAKRFISAEPLLGSLFEQRDRAHEIVEREGAHVCLACGADEPDCLCRTRKPLNLDGIDWVICGGESGSRESRPMLPAWARETRDACLAQDIAFHFKQFGSHDERGLYRGSAPKSGGKTLDGVDYCEFPKEAVTA